jgi:hypothetical protein
MTFNCINRLLSRYNIKSVGLLLRKISGFLQLVKYGLGLQTLEVYSSPVSVVRFAGDRPDLDYPGKSTMVKYSINLEHFVHPTPEHQYPLY